jgi:hypothetical protein
MVLGNASYETVSPSNLGRPHRVVVRLRGFAARRAGPACGPTKDNFLFYALLCRGSNTWHRYTCGLDLYLDRPDNSRDAQRCAQF